MIEPENMTGEEIDAAIAKRVMGFRRFDNWMGRDFWFDGRGEPAYPVYFFPGEDPQAWRPTQDVAQAFLVIKRLNELGVKVCIMDQLGYTARETGAGVDVDQGGLWRIFFMNDSADDLEGRDVIWPPNWNAQHESVAMAICHAALHVIEGLEGVEGV